MKRTIKNFVLILTLIVSMTSASYSGPFLFWGMDNLNDMKIPTLQAIDDKELRNIYSGASSIVVFIRNATTKLNYENFPRLSEIIGTTEWLYLPQEALSSDPLEYNVNAEVFVLTGPVEQQDVEIAALYRDAQVNFGKKNILGVLATRNDNIDHTIYKRQANLELTTTEIPSTTPGDELEIGKVYEVKGKGLLYTTEVPILNIRGNKSIDDVTYSLVNDTLVTADERGDLFRLIIKFVVPDKIIYIKFVFQVSAGKWSLKEVEVDHLGTTTLTVVGNVPSAPLGFSYACAGSLLFKKDGMSLLLRNIQAQPLLQGAAKFSKAYDCVGIMSPAILSGIFVTFIIGIALTIGITAILDIKTPNKFENRSAKQLTFTVQE